MLKFWSVKGTVQLLSPLNLYIDGLQKVPVSWELFLTASFSFNGINFLRI